MEEVDGRLTAGAAMRLQSLIEKAWMLGFEPSGKRAPIIEAVWRQKNLEKTGPAPVDSSDASKTSNALMMQFLTWISDRPRTYAEAMEAWRSMCPRHTVWEDALMDGLIMLESAGRPGETLVGLTPRGRALLDGRQDPPAIAAP
jgi:hypothetical protein